MIISKAGFTLAEALTALTIIGVVAALTLPIAYGNYRDEIRNTKVKNFFKIMNNAIEDAHNEHYNEPFIKICSDSEDYCRNEIITIMNNLRPHLPISKDCGFEPNEECVYTGHYKHFGNCDADDTSLSNTNENFFGNGRFYTFNLSDGAHVYIATWKSHISTDNNKIGYEIYYDMNGDKGPNRKGRDFFTFVITNEQIMEPFTANYGNIFLDDCTENKKTVYSAGCARGTTCAYKILNNIKY